MSEIIGMNKKLNQLVEVMAKSMGPSETVILESLMTYAYTQGYADGYASGYIEANFAEKGQPDNER